MDVDMLVSFLRFFAQHGFLVCGINDIQTMKTCARNNHEINLNTGVPSVSSAKIAILTEVLLRKASDFEGMVENVFANYAVIHAEQLDSCFST